MRYPGRPGISPAVAALIAAGRIRPEHRILDVGCGTGTDALLLARWGYRHVKGIDSDRGAIAIARARATRARVRRRVEFLHGSAEDLLSHVKPRSIDVVLHTLVGNNLRKQFHRHFAAVAAVMRRDGLLVATIRTQASAEHAAPGRVTPLPGMRKYFRLSQSVSSPLAEKGDFAPPHARTALWLGRPRARVQAQPI